MTKQRMMSPVLALAVALGAALVLTARPVSAGNDHKQDCQRVLRHADLEVQTPVVWAVLAPPIFPVRGSDGRIHLVYELTVTSLAPVPVQIETVEVIDPTRDDLNVAILSGDEVASRLVVVSGPADVPATLGPNGTGALLFDVTFATREDVPEVLVHRVTVALDLAPVPVEITGRGGCTEVSRRHALVLSPPLQGDGWANVDGCCIGDEHRRGISSFNGMLQSAQRFATDFMRGDAEGRVFVGDPTDVTHWVGYRAEVVAATSGRVLTVVDGFPDQVPLQELPDIAFAHPFGNHVIIAMDGGRFALYAHLAPHSIAVHEGEYVRPGQRLGLLGNSGLSILPHLHFHVMDRPFRSNASGVPYVFDQWTFQGRIEGLDLETGIAEVDLTGSGEHRSKELPLYFDAIGFRDPRRVRAR